VIDFKLQELWETCFQPFHVSKSLLILKIPDTGAVNFGDIVYFVMEKKDSYDNVEAPSRGGRRERRQPLTDNLDMTTTTGAEGKADGKNDTEVPESKPRGRRRNADGQQSSSSSSGGGGWMSSGSTKGNKAQISLNTDDDDNNNKDNQVSGNRDKHFQDDNDGNEQQYQLLLFMYTGYYMIY